MFQTFLVVGGYNPPISSTELLVETAAAWEFAGNLPSPRTGLRAARIDSRILATGLSIPRHITTLDIRMWPDHIHTAILFLGGADPEDPVNTFDDILEFSPATGQWWRVARMVQARRSHAVSEVRVADIEEYCTAESSAGGHHWSWLQSSLMTLLLTLVVWPGPSFNKYSYQRNRSTQKILVKKVCCSVGRRCRKMWGITTLFIFTPSLDELPGLQLRVF